MSPIIHRRRTVAANSQDRLRALITDLKRSVAVSVNLKTLETQARKLQTQDYDLSYPEAQSEVLQEWINQAQSEILEWVLREIFQETP